MQTEEQTGDRSKVTETKPKKLKELPRDSIKLQFAGDLILARLLDNTYRSLFQKYQVFFESMANLERDDRILVYKMMCCLMLTSHAKRVVDRDERRKIFDFKNKLFLSLANNESLKKKLSFRYLISPRALVTEFCPECTEFNEKEKLSYHKRKHCEKCKVDKEFFNILSMQHKFARGSACVFISNEFIKEIPGVSLKYKASLNKVPEVLRFQKYSFSGRNLTPFHIDSVVAMAEMLLKK